MPFIDLNSDVRESFANWSVDHHPALRHYVSNANVTCNVLATKAAARSGLESARMIEGCLA